MRDPDSNVESRCVAIDGTRKHLLITDWTKLLDNMEERLKDSKSGLAELGQLRGLVQFTNSGVGKASLPGEELVNRVTEIGKTSRWLDTRGLRATPLSYGYGRYANLGRRYTLCVWLGVNLDLFEEFASTRLWVHCDNWSDADTRFGGDIVYVVGRRLASSHTLTSDLAYVYCLYQHVLVFHPIGQP